VSKEIVYQGRNALDLVRMEDGTLPTYSWPGGYPVFYLDGGGSVLCPACARNSDQEGEVPRFRPCAAGVNWEDAELDCDNCNARIPSAYAED